MKKTAKQNAITSKRENSSTAEMIQKQERRLRELSSFLSNANVDPSVEETDWIRNAIRAARARGASELERNQIILDWVELQKSAHDAGLPTERTSTATRIREQQERQLLELFSYLSIYKVIPPLEEFNSAHEAHRAAKARGVSAEERNQIFLDWLERHKKAHEAGHLEERV